MEPRARPDGSQDQSHRAPSSNSSARVSGPLYSQARERYNSYLGEQGVVAPNLLKREFNAQAPNEKWVTDVAEFSVGYRKLYLSPVVDLFDRQIISYSIGSSPNLNLTTTSLRHGINLQAMTATASR